MGGLYFTAKDTKENRENIQFIKVQKSRIKICKLLNI